mmetsp:Transcript_107/g.825  ORF Transcript_107/g.825 Transcript_107/m.825 type:complete len:209 (+) Transcript_107:237-863(+)
MRLFEAVRRVVARVRSSGGVTRAGVLTGLADGNYGCVRRGWRDDEARNRPRTKRRTERTRRGSSRDVPSSQRSSVDVADGGRTQAHHAEERIHREIRGTRRVGQQVLRSVRRNRISSTNRTPSMGGICQPAQLQLDQRPTRMAWLAASHHRPLSGQSQVSGGTVQDSCRGHKDRDAGKLPTQRIVESRTGSKELEKVHSMDWVKKSMN